MTVVVLRTAESEVCRIRCGAALKEFSMRWNYIVRQRHRWTDDAAARERQTRRLQLDLRKLGVTTRHLKRLKGVVEVGVPDSEHDRFWEAKILPWEFVLTAATKPYRSRRDLLVVRHLKTRRRKRRRTPKTYAMIETAPGDLGRSYDFSAERALVDGSLSHLEQVSGGAIRNPTVEQLGDAVRIASPDILHVSGIDNRAGRELRGIESGGVRDGLYFADPSESYREYRAETIAEILNLGSPNPLFVGFNCWDSAARLAPMTIHRGSRAAIGFQHTFDEKVAEIFFLSFYQACVESDWDLLSGFCTAWDAVYPFREQIRGSSIVLWTADSLVTGTRSRDAVPWTGDRSKMRVATAVVPAESHADPGVHRISDLLSVVVRSKPQLNYSSLHNGDSLFDQLTIRFHPSATLSDDSVLRVEDLELEVLLHVGADSYPYRSRLSLNSETYRYDLEGRVKLPLTGQLFQTLSERIQTSLFVDVRWHDQVLYRQTHPVWLTPIDQWTLDDRQLGWLPSFVQPRDPAVGRTIGIAKGYLQCLSDNPNVGFNGYQSYDSYATGSACWDGIDRQARSIWSALLLAHELHYINPPPSYTAFTQRLRTPSDTIEGGFGTCVDLALLFASCLEWIEVHPVLFLLHGHVFPGYWKDLTAHRRFRDVSIDKMTSTRDRDDLPRDKTLQRWVSDEKTYAEIKAWIDSGELVPLETVGLTTGEGFAEAIDAGRNHFYKKRSRAFRAMIDLVSARQSNSVTPLPLNFSTVRNHDLVD